VPVECEKLVYLELQKTACTTIGAILCDLFAGEQVRPKHGRLPDPTTSKCVVGSVRNPWDYYVSLWAFGCQGRGELHQLLTERHWKGALGRLPAPGPLLGELSRPVASWRRSYAPPHAPEQFRSWLDRIHAPAHACEFDTVYSESRLRFVAGYASYRYCRLYASDFAEVLDSQTMSDLVSRVEAGYLPRVMIRMEHLADDLIAAVRVAGYVVDDTLEEVIRERAGTRSNTSSHMPYTDYYDDACRELVSRRDSLIISRHGYSFGS
jgi:hypothetical protein